MGVERAVYRQSGLSSKEGRNPNGAQLIGAQKTLGELILITMTTPEIISE